MDTRKGSAATSQHTFLMETPLVRGTHPPRCGRPHSKASRGLGEPWGEGRGMATQRETIIFNN